MLGKGTALTRSLHDLDHFRSADPELRTLCWWNGLELSPASLHQRLLKAETLSTETSAA
ncbi:MAG: hypothetical protein QF922_01745 [SAR324 cluster bacterium]|jgi:hypothetical protein|nr:hypothetical protein [SAR324 cluster bacterium]